MVIIGFIVNPIAGMGGRVGLKGTDGEAYILALKKGAKPVAPRRALEFLNSLTISNIEFYVAPGPMGEDIILKSKYGRSKFKVVGSLKSKHTTAEDTKRVASEMVKEGISLLVFVGGDGTARDVLDAVDLKVPVLGVPSGVKMYSAVFAVNPKAAARIVEAYVKGYTMEVLAEVMDIDEDAYRRNELKIQLYGYMRVPVISGLVQSCKEPSINIADEEENRIAIARRIIEEMEPDTLYILGPGTTVKTICDMLGLNKTLLGVDAIYNGVLVGRDLDEKGLLELLKKYPKAKIIVSPIGGQGFIFGRGNQQISPKVIRLVGRSNIIVIATHRKMRSLETLRVDTGDEEVDRMLRGYIRVIVDYNEDLVVKVV